MTSTISPKLSVRKITTKFVHLNGQHKEQLNGVMDPAERGIPPVGGSDPGRKPVEQQLSNGPTVTLSRSRTAGKHQPEHSARKCAFPAQHKLSEQTEEDIFVTSAEYSNSQPRHRPGTTSPSAISQPKVSSASSNTTLPGPPSVITASLESASPSHSPTPSSPSSAICRSAALHALPHQSSQTLLFVPEQRRVSTISGHSVRSCPTEICHLPTLGVKNGEYSSESPVTAAAES